MTVYLVPRNDQQAYDIAVKHLMSMEKPAGEVDSNDFMFCSYRTPDGNRCAIGAMISDEQYHPILDDHDIQESSAVEHLNLHGYIDIGNIELMLLVSLQRAHDNPRNWGPGGFTNLGLLRTIAKEYSVSSSLLDSLFEGLPSWSKNSR